MVGRPTCPECGGELTGPRGHCPRCLLRAGLDGESLSLGGGGAVGVTMALEKEGPPGVLADLTATIGEVPRVLLRDADSDSGHEPPARPGSDAMPAPGERGGTLQILGEIARGGMGAVLKGRDADLGRDLAVKVLLDRHRDQPELVRRFVEEAQIAGQLQHPGIVPVYQLGAFADRRPFFTMKLVKGRTLAEILRDRADPGHDRPRLLAIFLPVAQAVAYAHARGVIHRDLKPSNVMVGAFGEVQVMDWGLAKVLPRGGAVDDATAGRKDASETVIATARSGGGDDSDLSRAGSVLGTPAYMAPEQARGEVDRLDERCDVFALGSILCEVLTGEPAFTGRNSGEIQRKAAWGEAADARVRLDASGADPELLALAAACLAPEAEDRPRDAGAVAEKLAAHLAGAQERLRAAELAGAAERARAEEAEARARAERQARRLTLALAASIVGLIALGAGGSAWVERQRAGRAARAAAAVDQALAEAERSAVAARAAAAGAELKWSETCVLAQRADDLARQGDADAPTRSRAAAALERLGRERAEAAAQARQAEADRRLVAQLVAARLAGYGVDISGAIAESGYGEAFRAAGLDPDGQPAAAGTALRARPPAVAQAAAAALDDWAATRRKRRPDPAAAARLARAARAADPDPWRCQLRDALELPDRQERLARLRRLAEDARPEVLGPVSLELLGRALTAAHDIPAAERLLVAAQRRYPDDPWINGSLAMIFFYHEQFSAALPYFSAARAVYPESAHWMGDCLGVMGKLDDAEAVFRDLIRRQPQKVDHQACLGSVLRRMGRSREAAALLDATAAQARAALERRSDRDDLWMDLVYVSSFQGNTAAVISAAREVIQRAPYAVAAHMLLAIGLCDDRRYAEAEAAGREATRLRPDYWPAQVLLGTALRHQGKLDEALTAYRRAQELLGVPGTPSAAELAAMIGRTERQQALAPRLAAVLRGDDRPQDAAEGIDLAGICLDRDLPAAAARLLAGALAADPARADAHRAAPSERFWLAVLRSNNTPPRTEAARACALAGTGQGRDAPPAEGPARATLRGQALDYLRTEHAAWARELDRDDPASARRVRDGLSDWLTDPDLDAVHRPEALAALPQTERAEWQALWDEVDVTLQRAAGAQR